MKKEYKGFISVGYGECEESIMIEDSEMYKEALAELIQDDIGKHGNFLTVKYFLSDKEITLEQANDSLIKQIEGVGEADYMMRYSEYTG
jgi:hypothetical protein